MKRRLIAYAFVFAASAAVGYLTTQPASAATHVTVSVNAQPVHYRNPPARYYYPPARYYYPPAYYYSPRNPAAYWKWRNRYKGYDGYNFNGRHDRRYDNHRDRDHDPDRDHQRSRDRDHDRDRDGHWGR